jgi:Flp pilus assembly protein TadB
MEHRPRIGAFFLLVGLVLLILFLGSVVIKDVNVVFLVLSLGTLLLAYVFRRRTPQDSGRFGTIRRVSEHSRQRREERQQKKASRSK